MVPVHQRAVSVLEVTAIGNLHHARQANAMVGNVDADRAQVANTQYDHFFYSLLLNQIIYETLKLLDQVCRHLFYLIRVLLF